ncbi:MAG: hypothetical protein M1827_006865 [Pycnora praestabilis]|nr:MAG: hypothetical protein M1827_006865 [Pycnora praestabilis]
MQQQIMEQHSASIPPFEGHRIILVGVLVAFVSVSVSKMLPGSILINDRVNSKIDSNLEVLWKEIHDLKADKAEASTQFERREHRLQDDVALAVNMTEERMIEEYDSLRNQFEVSKADGEKLAVRLSEVERTFQEEIIFLCRAFSERVDCRLTSHCGALQRSIRGAKDDGLQLAATLEVMKRNVEEKIQLIHQVLCFNGIESIDPVDDGDNEGEESEVGKCGDDCHYLSFPSSSSPSSSEDDTLYTNNMSPIPGKRIGIQLTFDTPASPGGNSFGTPITESTTVPTQTDDAYAKNSEVAQVDHDELRQYLEEDCWDTTNPHVPDEDYFADTDNEKSEGWFHFEAGINGSPHWRPTGNKKGSTKETVEAKRTTKLESEAVWSDISLQSPLPKRTEIDASMVSEDAGVRMAPRKFSQKYRTFTPPSTFLFVCLCFFLCLPIALASTLSDHPLTQGYVDRCGALHKTYSVQGMSCAEQWQRHRDVVYRCIEENVGPDFEGVTAENLQYFGLYKDVCVEAGWNGEL